MSEKKRLKEIMELAKQLGCQFAGQTSKRHLKFRHPKSTMVVIIAPSSDDPRAMKNAKTHLQRMAKIQ